MADFSTIIETQWNVLGEHIQEKWTISLTEYGVAPVNVWTVGTVLVMMLIYWSYALVSTFIDIFNIPYWMSNYFGRQLMVTAILHVLFNQVVITPSIIGCSYYIIWMFSELSPVIKLPTFKTFSIHLILMCLLEEPLYYYANRLRHHPSVHRLISNARPDWTSLIAVTTFFCSPIEFALCNVFPILVSVYVLQSHVIVLWTFTIIATFYSMSNHTGYFVLLPLSLNSAHFQNYYRATYNCNFGVFGWFDKLHGTYRGPRVGRMRLPIKMRRRE